MAPVGEVFGREMFTKTKMCKFHRMGKCAKGTQCPWAHSASELKEVPDLSRTKLCRELIAKGHCTNANCKYAHSKKECRAADFSHQVPASKEAVYAEQTSTIRVADLISTSLSADAQDFVPMGFTADTPAFVPMLSPPPGLEDCMPCGPLWGYPSLQSEETRSERSSNNDITPSGNSPIAHTLASKRQQSWSDSATASTSASLADLQSVLGVGLQP
eukprot:TRINITY_DN1484_c0_g5_i1.p1 TRINITY_DN1484_c0_g5~~TRINITY_DN1484_c0_g5_i1.p1  ORF type:complete len:216 (-),score=30.63 TRINITY_DN1484_c0_g5_i1:333-980(-)